MARKTGEIPVFGAFVDRVAPGSPAEQSGLAVGDIITAVDQRPIGGAGDLEEALASATPGSRLTIVFVRKNQRLKAEATV
ncbi:MAG: PDZ domain-containing protein [Chloroflexi bacterium]|nr:PDZ domain-containing protein [Chloroflexota bacterium]